MYEVYPKRVLSSLNVMNLYRGCTNGCIYCDARSDCYQINKPFEDVEAKISAPEILEKELQNRKNACMIGTGAMSDPYLHAEIEQKITRRSLEVIDKYGCGVTIQTKSSRILRDLDLLTSINEKAKCVVQMSLTTYDDDITKVLEPNVSNTKERFETLKILRENRIPTIIWLDPIFPFINDTKENLVGIMEYAREAAVYGIVFFGFGLTLRPGSRELSRLFYGMCKKEGIIYNRNEIFDYLHAMPKEKKKEKITIFSFIK